jgi:hypothetical protein
VYRRVVAASGRIFQASSLEQSAEIVKRYPPFELHESPLDYVL